MRRLSSAVLATAVMVSIVQAGSAARALDGDREFYLALGDSLSVGFQPGSGETTQGYVNDVYRTIRDRRIPRSPFATSAAPAREAAR